jgi:hypothetical protein
MSFLQKGIYFCHTLLVVLSRLSIPVKRQNRTYDYTKYISGIDYIFEEINSTHASMTAHYGGVKVGDRIILIHSSRYTQYLICEINYYLNVPDLWIALLIIQ